MALEERLRAVFFVFFAVVLDGILIELIWICDELRESVFGTFSSKKRDPLKNGFPSVNGIDHQARIKRSRRVV